MPIVLCLWFIWVKCACWKLFLLPAPILCVFYPLNAPFSPLEGPQMLKIDLGSVFCNLNHLVFNYFIYQLFMAQENFFCGGNWFWFLLVYSIMTSLTSVPSFKHICIQLFMSIVLCLCYLSKMCMLKTIFTYCPLLCVF